MKAKKRKIIIILLIIIPILIIFCFCFRHTLFIKSYPLDYEINNINVNYNISDSEEFETIELMPYFSEFRLFGAERKTIINNPREYVIATEDFTVTNTSDKALNFLRYKKITDFIINGESVYCCAEKGFLLNDFFAMETALNEEADYIYSNVTLIMKKEDCEKINESFDNVEIKAEFSGKNMDSIWNF